MTIRLSYSKAKDLVSIVIENPNEPLTVEALCEIFNSILTGLSKEPDFNEPKQECGAI